MLKILVVTPACHFASIGAAQRDIYAGLVLLQKLGHTVALHTIDSPAQDRAGLQSWCERLGIEVNFFQPKNSGAARLARLLAAPALFDGSADVFAQLVRDQSWQHFIQRFEPEAIISFCSYSWPVLRYAQERGIRALFRSHNFEPSFFWEALAGKAKWSPLNWLRYLAKYAAEYKAGRSANAVGTLPVEQMRLYRRWNQAVAVLSLLFLPECLRPPQVAAGKSPLDVFYLGASYNVVFHRRGAEVLIKDIAPRVLARAPGAFRFHICGAKLPPALVARCQGDIIYEGYVPDLDGFLAQMDIGAFPVFTGKTMKGKVFESLARSFPLVIAANCRGGYELNDNQEVSLANSTEEFVEQIIALRDVNQRRQLAAGAHRFAQSHFSEGKIVQVLNQLLYGPERS